MTTRISTSPQKSPTVRPTPGCRASKNRDDDEFFYPEKVAAETDKNTGAKTEQIWPEGVRRYSYRKDPELPSGNTPGHDNIQIAFNVLPEAAKAVIQIAARNHAGIRQRTKARIMNTP